MLFYPILRFFLKMNNCFEELLSIDIINVYFFGFYFYTSLNYLILLACLLTFTFIYFLFGILLPFWLFS